MPNRTVDEIRANVAVGMHSPADTHVLLAEIDRLAQEPATLHTEIDGWRAKYLDMLSQRDALAARIAAAEAASASARDALMFALAQRQFAPAPPPPQPVYIPSNVVPHGDVYLVPAKPWWKVWGE